MAFLPHQDQQTSYSDNDSEDEVAPGQDDEEIEKQVKRLPFSLFNRDVSEHQANYHLKSQSTDKSANRAYEAAARLICSKINEIDPQDLRKDIDENPTSIHSWSNLAVYAAQNGNLVQAKQAWEKIVKLRKDRTAVAEEKASFAFWIAELVRSEDHREKASDLLEEVVFQTPDLDRHEVRENAAFWYMKVLVRYAKSEFARDKTPDWFQSKLEKVVSLLKIMIHSDRFKDDNAPLIWLWIAEVMCVHGFMRLKEKLDDQLAKLDVEFNVRKINFEMCMDRIIELCTLSGDSVANSKVIARAAKNAAVFAMSPECEDTEHERRLQLAINLSQKSLDMGEEHYMAKWTIGKCHMALWARNVYAVNKSIVDAEHSAVLRRPPQSDSRAYTFITSGAYMIREDNLALVRDHLEVAHKHWQEMESQFGSEWDRTSKLAKLKFILGRKDEEVEETFRNATSGPKPKDSDFSAINAYQFFGRFYEKTNRQNQAILMYNEAIESAEGNKGKPFIAINRLQDLQQGNSYTRGRGGRGRSGHRGGPRSRGGQRGRGGYGEAAVPNFHHDGRTRYQPRAEYRGYHNQPPFGAAHQRGQFRGGRPRGPSSSARWTDQSRRSADGNDGEQAEDLQARMYETLRFSEGNQ